MSLGRATTWMLAIVLMIAATPVALGQGGGASGNAPPGQGPDGDGPPGRQDGNGTGNASDARGRSDVRAEHQSERSEFFKEQAQERQAFQAEQKEHRQNASAQELNETEKQAMEERLEAEREAFLARQQAEREAFLEAQRQEQRQVELAHREAWAKGRPDDLPTPERVGRFGAAGDAAQGRYVTFNYSLDAATLRDVRAGGQLLFDAVRLQGNASSAGLTGAVFTLEGAAGAVMVHDNPAGVIRAEPASGGGFVLDLADYLQVEGNGTAWSVSDGDALAATLQFQRAPGYDDVNRTFTGAGEARFVARALQPHLNASNAHRDEIHDAIAQRDVGAEVTLVGAGDGVAEETLLYDDMNVSVVESEGGKVRLRVDGEGDTGKTLVVNLDAGLLKGDRLQFGYFDVVNNTTSEVPIVEASSLADVLDPNDDSTPEYWVVEDADGVQVLVTVPHFSVHEVEIQSVELASPPTIIGGALAAVIFVGAAAAGMFRRPRE